MTHPARLSACFASGVSEAVALRLMENPRFADRISRMLDDAYGTFDAEDLTDADSILIGLGRTALEALSLRAGIVVHAKGFVREIRGPVLAERAARFGEGALADARAHADLALDRAPMTDLDALERAIRADGLECLAAWIDDLPILARKRLMLEWPTDDDLPRTGFADINARGAEILRRLSPVALS